MYNEHIKYKQFQMIFMHQRGTPVTPFLQQNISSLEPPFFLCDKSSTYCYIFLCCSELYKVEQGDRQTDTHTHTNTHTHTHHLSMFALHTQGPCSSHPCQWVCRPNIVRWCVCVCECV